jgi:ComF family protein
MLSEELHRLFRKGNEDLKGWILVSPPRSSQRKAQFGFDHAERLARSLAHYTGGRYVRVFKRKGGQEQKNLSGTERLQNARESLALAHPNRCRGKKIILTDDIFTTGATLQSCLQLLRQAGAEAVFCATVLKTTPRSGHKAHSHPDSLWFEA